MCVLCLFFTVMLLIGMLISSWQQQQELTKHPVPLRRSVCVSAGIIVNVCMMKFRKEDVAMHYTIFVSPSSSLYVLFLHLHKAKLEKHATSFFLLLISPEFLTIATFKICINETRSLLREIFLYPRLDRDQCTYHELQKQAQKGVIVIICIAQTFWKCFFWIPQLLQNYLVCSVMANKLCNNIHFEWWLYNQQHVAHLFCCKEFVELEEMLAVFQHC